MNIRIAIDRRGFDVRNQRILNELRDPNKVLRVALTNMHALISERVQIFGLLSNGSAIGGGVYSRQWKRVRQNEGRQTGFIDLTFSGDMFRNFNIYPVPKGFGLGFANKDQYDKMKWNEDYFGVFILPSAKEQELAFKDIQDSVDGIIRRN